MRTHDLAKLNKRPLISVIVPIYNAEQYLDCTLHSIVTQTHTDLEIILVDDGSEDSSGAICDQWAAKDARVVAFHQKNAGVSSARNHGLKIAKGNFIAFVDSDDLIREDMFELLYKQVEENDAEMGICDFCRVDPGENPFPALGASCSGYTVNSYEILELLSGERYLFAAALWNKLYRKELFEGIQFPVGKISEDGYVIHQLIGKCSCIAIVPEKLYAYVRRPESLMHKGWGIQHLTHLEACYQRIKYYENNNFTDLCPKATQYMMIHYFRLQKKVPIRTKEEKRRFKEIRRMVRYCYLRHGAGISRKKILLFEFPKLECLLYPKKTS